MSYHWHHGKFCHKTVFKLFQLMSGGKNFKHLITAPWPFSRASSLAFHLVTVAIFSNFKIQLKYNLGLPSKVGMSSIRESLASL